MANPSHREKLSVPLKGPILANFVIFSQSTLNKMENAQEFEGGGGGSILNFRPQGGGGISLSFVKTEGGRATLWY